jgi:hypothetical protein
MRGACLRHGVPSEASEGPASHSGDDHGNSEWIAGESRMTEPAKLGYA